MQTTKNPGGVTYLNVKYGIRSWAFTRDHKRIALLYLGSITCFFLLAGCFAAVMRIELMTPAGDLVGADTFNKLFTMHGVMMVYFFLIPSIPAVLGNFLVPPMIGAQRPALPRLNLLSWYLFTAGGICALWTAATGGVDAGWNFLRPYATAYSPTQVSLAATSVLLALISATLVNLNLVVTILRRRAPGMRWSKLPLFVWMHLFSGVATLLAAPFGCYLFWRVIADRVPAGQALSPVLAEGGLFSRGLFWLFVQATVFILLLPAIGIVSEIFPCFSRRRLAGRRSVLYSALGLAILGTASWGTHLFDASAAPAADLLFTLFALLLFVPVAVLVFNWLATLHRGAIRLDTPMLYALGFLGLFLVGECAQLFLGALPLGRSLLGTQFEGAQLHYLLSGAVLMAYLGGLHFWWPKMTGKMYPVFLGRVGALVIFVGFNLTFFPLLVAGYLGMPERVHAYASGFQVLQALSTGGASILGLGYLLPVCYLSWSLRYGKPVQNPWDAEGLEWTIPSPPPPANFEEEPDLPGVPEPAV